MIYLGADHGGFELKNKIKIYLESINVEYSDLGNLEFDKEDDYPIYAFKVAEAAAKNNSKGVLLCRSAGGVIIAANKVKGIKAVAVTDVKSAEHAVLHNDANVIGVSGDWMDDDVVKDVVKVFIDTEFSNDDRHVRRLKMIEDYEK